jgi:hypothetical protein
LNKDARACSAVLKEHNIREATVACYRCYVIAEATEERIPQNRREDKMTVPQTSRRTEPSTRCRLTDYPLVHQLGVTGLDENERLITSQYILLRKEVIQPHLPVRLPCYDFTPITDPTFDGSFLAVRPPASGVANFRGVTGGVYKARERIHPGVLIRDY